MTMAILDDRRFDDDTAIGLRLLAKDGVLHAYVLPVDLNDRLIVAGLATTEDSGRKLRLTDDGWAAARAMTPEAKTLRLATAFGREISDEARAALRVVALHASDDELLALAAEIHALSVAAAPITPAQAHLEEWIT